MCLQVPFSILFGVFLYMGVSSIGSIQLMDRITLLIVPVKHHGNTTYVKRVNAAYLLCRKWFSYTY